MALLFVFFLARRLVANVVFFWRYTPRSPKMHEFCHKALHDLLNVESLMIKKSFVRLLVGGFSCISTVSFQMMHFACRHDSSQGSLQMRVDSTMPVISIHHENYIIITCWFQFRWVLLKNIISFEEVSNFIDKVLTNNANGQLAIPTVGIPVEWLITSTGQDYEARLCRVLEEECLLRWKNWRVQAAIIISTNPPKNGGNKIWDPKTRRLGGKQRVGLGLDFDSCFSKLVGRLTKIDGIPFGTFDCSGCRGVHHVRLKQRMDVASFITSSSCLCRKQNQDDFLSLPPHHVFFPHMSLSSWK